MLSHRNQYRAGRAEADCEPGHISGDISDPAAEEDNIEQEPQMVAVCEYINHRLSLYRRQMIFAWQIFR
jgi:hypothetical protein